MPRAYAGVDDAAAITEAVLAFWFERDIAPGNCEVRPVWFESLGADAVHRFVIGAARGHRDVVERFGRFGRFPHRNDILGRQTTAEEAAFLASPEGEFWLA